MQTIEKLQAEGFEGVDISLDISLFEYGIAWKHDTEEKEVKVYYGIKTNDQGNYTKFDWASFHDSIDCILEFDWVNWDEFLSFIGSDFADWDNQVLGQKLFDLFNYYGNENIFGSSYTEGFEIAK